MTIAASLTPAVRSPYLGLDIAPGILADVPGPVAVADATRLPLATASVDAASALHMLYHAHR